VILINLFLYLICSVPSPLIPFDLYLCLIPLCLNLLNLINNLLNKSLLLHDLSLYLFLSVLPGPLIFPPLDLNSPPDLLLLLVSIRLSQVLQLDLINHSFSLIPEMT